MLPKLGHPEVPKTLRQISRSRFLIVNGKTSIWPPASAFLVGNNEGYDLPISLDIS
jgi:hypothetical protein